MRYAMSSKWWPERFTISDDAGQRFEVRNSPGFTTQLSLRVVDGEEIAAIRRRRGGRFQVIVRGRETGLVRPRARGRYDIHSALGPLTVAGDVAGGQYEIAGGLVTAAVSRHHVPQGRTISVHIGGGDDAAAPLATVLAIEAIQYERDGAYVNPLALLDLLNPFKW